MLSSDIMYSFFITVKCCMLEMARSHNVHVVMQALPARQRVSEFDDELYISSSMPTLPASLQSLQHGSLLHAGNLAAVARCSRGSDSSCTSGTSSSNKLFSTRAIGKGGEGSVYWSDKLIPLGEHQLVAQPLRGFWPQGLAPVAVKVVEGPISLRQAQQDMYDNRELRKVHPAILPTLAMRFIPSSTSPRSSSGRNSSSSSSGGNAMSSRNRGSYKECGTEGNESETDKGTQGISKEGSSHITAAAVTSSNDPISPSSSGIRQHPSHSSSQNDNDRFTPPADESSSSSTSTAPRTTTDAEELLGEDWYLMPWCPFSLSKLVHVVHEVLDRPELLGPEVVTKMLAVLLGIFAACQAEGYVLSDIKADNIMVDSQGNLRLIDTR